MTIGITKKNAKHSSTRTKKNYNDYDVNYNKSTYDELFNAFVCCLKEQDWEETHITEDAILKKFINEILNNKYKTKQEIIAQARLIDKKILSKPYKKWYS
jgi:hypothetical protein